MGAAIDRPLLGKQVVGNEVQHLLRLEFYMQSKSNMICMLQASSVVLQEGMQRLEAIVHPLVVEHRNTFMAGIVKHSSQSLVLFDIPLLFETHAENQVCYMAVLTSIANDSKMVRLCVHRLTALQ